MGFKDAVSADPLTKNHSVKHLAFEGITRKPYTDSSCLFRALALPLHGNERLEK